jgi:hypothetical protein
MQSKYALMALRRLTSARQAGLALHCAIARSRSLAWSARLSLNGHRAAIGDIGERDATGAADVLEPFFQVSASPRRGMFSDRARYGALGAQDQHAALAARGIVASAGEVAGIDISLRERIRPGCENRA